MTTETKETPPGPPIASSWWLQRPRGAWFDPGKFRVTVSAHLAFGPIAPSPEPRPPQGVLDILRRMMLGDWGDTPPGRVARNVEAARSGRGEIVASFGQCDARGPLTIIVRTVLRPRGVSETLVYSSRDDIDPAGG